MKSKKKIIIVEPVRELVPDALQSQWPNAGSFYQIRALVDYWLALRWPDAIRGTYYDYMDYDATHISMPRNGSTRMVSSDRHVRCNEKKKYERKSSLAIHPSNVYGQIKTYRNTKMMAIGIKKISEKATKRRIFDVCSSTMEISKRAPHHEFWPNVCKKKV